MRASRVEIGLEGNAGGGRTLRGIGVMRVYSRRSSILGSALRTTCGAVAALGLSPEGMLLGSRAWRRGPRTSATEVDAEKVRCTIEPSSIRNLMLQVPALAGDPAVGSARGSAGRAELPEHVDLASCGQPAGDAEAPRAVSPARVSPHAASPMEPGPLRASAARQPLSPLTSCSAACGDPAAPLPAAALTLWHSSLRGLLEWSRDPASR
jgi:hypothetical protein